VLAVQDCGMRYLTSGACQLYLSEDPRGNSLRDAIPVMNTAVNFVCRDNVEGMLVVFVLVFIILIQ